MITRLFRSRRETRGCVSVALSVSLILATAALPAAAQESAVIQGGILDDSGNPAEGMRVLFKDVRSGVEFTSPPSNRDGEYRIEVPAGTRYQLVAVIAPDGTRLPVQQIAPLPIMVPTTVTLNVAFKAREEAPQPPPRKVTEPTEVAKKPPKSPGAGKPWWKRPGGVVGIVLGVAAAGLAVGGGDNGASPSKP